ncbi:MAG: sulfotransferase family protein [Marinilabiliaceae bacterium]
MEKKESPLVTFTRKLREHDALKKCPNNKLVCLVYLKLLLSEPFRRRERKKYKEMVDRIDPEKAPVFIIGHWRSGTTYLHQLMSQDPDFFYQTKYQNFFSDNFLSSEEFFKPVISRFMQFSRPVREWKSNISRTMNLDDPSESDTALISEISEVTYHWAHLFPKSYKEYFDKYLFFENLSKEELEEWKYTMRTLLNKTYLKHDSGRLLIKNPGDTARIRYLLDIYPNAKFVFIHRNPYEVFYSNMKLWSHVLKTVSLQQISEEEKRKIVLDIYQKLHRQYLDQRELLRSDQLAEISHQDILHSPKKTLKGIYHKLDLKNFDEALPHFEHFLAQQPPVKDNNYSLHPGDAEEINKQWNFAFRLWDYPVVPPNPEKTSIAG